jgi:hypothetical protein
MAIAKWVKVAPEGLVYGTRPASLADSDIPKNATNLVDQQLIANYLALRQEHRLIVREVVEGLSSIKPYGQ